MATALKKVRFTLLKIAFARRFHCKNGDPVGFSLTCVYFLIISFFSMGALANYRAGWLATAADKRRGENCKPQGNLFVTKQAGWKASR